MVKTQHYNSKLHILYQFDLVAYHIFIDWNACNVVNFQMGLDPENDGLHWIGSSKNGPIFNSATCTTSPTETASEILSATQRTARLFSGACYIYFIRRY